MKERVADRPGRAAALLAALLVTAVSCVADALARSRPFGPRTRDVNDLGNQYVPFHAHLWDLLHGRADGGLLVNWQSGYGSSFLPDLGTYLGSPFALLVGVFPRDEIDLAVYVITVLKTASAGAAMAVLLLSLRPGRWWAAGLLGASYALCGWSVAVASYNPMWLDGLLALPLLCLVGEWTLRRRRPLLGVLVVALAWTANFYTAYMATLAAGLVLLLRLWLTGLPAGRRLRTAGRAAVTAALGVGLAAPLVTVVYFGTRHAYPGRTATFRPVSTPDLLARLLPTTYSFGSPALYVGTAALLLALALPFHRAAPRRVRAGWPLLLTAVALSFQWGPTHLVWHAFATPQGSPYRQAFVLCALLVITAWHTLSYGLPDPRALGAAGTLLALLTAVASRSALVKPVSWAVLALAVAGAAGGLALLRAAESHLPASVAETPPATKPRAAGPACPPGSGASAAGVPDGLVSPPGSRASAARLVDGLVSSPGSGASAAGVPDGLVSPSGSRASAARIVDGLVSPCESRASAAGLADGPVSPSGSRAAVGRLVDGLVSPPGSRATAAGLADGPASPLVPRAAPRRRTLLAVLAVVLLFGGQFGEAVATSFVATRQRFGHMDDYAPWGARQREQAEAVARADGWPRYRTDPGREQTVGNDPLMVGGQGAQYYSSLTSDVLSRTLTALGGGWTSRGRSVQSLDNAVTDAIFSVGARVHSPTDPHQAYLPPVGGPLIVSRADVPPLVTVRNRPDATPFGPSPYRNQELLLGSRVYTVPRTAVYDDAGKPLRSGRVGSGNALAAPVITAHCPAGSQVQLWAPHFSGTARLADETGFFRSARPRNRAAMEPLGTAPASGRIHIRLTPDRPGSIPQGAVGCLDTARLHAAVAHLKTTGATRVTVSGATVRAELPADSKGIAVVAAPRIAGWRCATGDGAAVPAKDHHGLIAVPLDGTSTTLTCTFHPPGLRLGTSVGAGSLLTPALLGVLAAVRRRRGTPPSPSLPTRPRERVPGAA
ncbi:YfhO family protein [Streptomyces sp. SLBN-31]|uniref:YfhO family protein n=1 Tax=Streptomyces sp. SLBN-31 TaxID=2768444 RepID=UPI0021B2D758|nr:YfhO family protein [Streptomyces sp. SLBN-31]